MEITNYCVIAGISIFFLIGCLAHLQENDIFSLEKIKKFRRLIYVLMFELIIDCTFVLLEESGVNKVVLYLIKSSELIINPTLAFLVFDIFYDKKKNRYDETMRKIRLLMLLALAANAILQFIAVFGWHVFYIDESSHYHRGPLVFVYILLLLFIVLALVRSMFTFSSKTQSTMRMTLLAFTAILIVGIFLRNIFPNSNYDFLCTSVATPFLLIYYSHVTLRVDPLTKLLNRQVYSRMIRRIGYTTIIVMIDANNFKQINDAYGHECGDQTLKQLAHVICKVYGRYAYCFRIGGDEFCAILKPDAFDKLIEEIPHRDVYSMAEKFIEKLNDAISAQNEADKGNGYLKYGVSQGYGIFYPEANYPSVKERMPIEKVIELADKRMYRNKEAFRKDHPELTDSPESNSTRAKVLYMPPTPTLS